MDGIDEPSTTEHRVEPFCRSIFQKSYGEELIIQESRDYSGWEGLMLMLMLKEDQSQEAIESFGGRKVERRGKRRADGAEHE